MTSWFSAIAQLSEREKGNHVKGGRNELHQRMDYIMECIVDHPTDNKENVEAEVRLFGNRMCEISRYSHCSVALIDIVAN
uniref:Rx_N domain-containing protein n=1 Tax=Steinernema glaseri TaxID=37863 RepID=A0A1I7ZN45_9BILA